MLTMLPPPLRRKAGSTAREKRNGPLRFVSITRSQSFFGNGFNRGDVQSAGVVDENVQPAESSLRFPNGFFCLLTLGHITDDGERWTPKLS